MFRPIQESMYDFQLDARHIFSTTIFNRRVATRSRVQQVLLKNIYAHFSSHSRINVRFSSSMLVPFLFLAFHAYQLDPLDCFGICNMKSPDSSELEQLPLRNDLSEVRNVVWNESWTGIRARVFPFPLHGYLPSPILRKFVYGNEDAFGNRT